MNIILFLRDFLIRRASLATVFLFFVFIHQDVFASEIIIQNRNAEVWLNKQTITGKLSGFISRQVSIYYNGSSFQVRVNKDSSFSFPLLLLEKNNAISVSAVDKGKKIMSETLLLTLGYTPLPVVKPFATLRQNKVVLHASVIENNAKKKLGFLWTDDPRNPTRVRISNNKSRVAKVVTPHKNGIYYFNLLVTSGKDSVRFQTYVTRRNGNLQPFRIETQYADWIDTAVIYEITPSYFVKKGTYNNIRDKLPELKTLGVNTIWLQPVYKSFGGGQGYDIIDYFSLRPELGTEWQLHRLIQSAHKLGMRVLFDFVPNHTSIHHPYVKDVLQFGPASHYYNFYQHTPDSANYSSNYHFDKNGFVYYFWKDLVNLNYKNAEVQQWMIEACKYWVKEYDIDGYRFDAVWGVNARAPAFGKRLRTELKIIKPDLLLLAEDKGSDKSVYDAGFDFAYDWTADTSWVSHWSWQYEYDPKDNLTIFNFVNAGKRASMLRKALFQNNPFIHRKLHFIENNDLPRFISDHGLARTKMAAALLYSLPGIPLMYCGQEVGFQSKLYSGKPIFSADTTIRSFDYDSLFTFYQKLIQLRTSHGALREKNIEELSVAPSNTLVAFKRESTENMFIILVNLHPDSSLATLDISMMGSRFFGKKSLQFKDVLTGKVFSPGGAHPSAMEIPMPGFTTRWLLVNDPSLVITNR